MPTFQTKPQFVLAFNFTGDVAMLAQMGCITARGFRMFDGTIVSENVARQRTYPLGQQPTEVVAILDNEGQLRAVRPGDWVVKEDQGKISVVSHDYFQANYMEAPAENQIWPVPPLA